MFEFMTLKGHCQLKIGTCHLPLQGLSQWPLWPLTFNTPWKEFRMEIRNEAFCALGKTGRTGLQIDTFRRRFFEPKFLHLLISRKALKWLMVTSALVIKERNAIESQNGVAMVQTSKVILGGITDVISDKSLYCWELEVSELCQTWDATSHSQNNVCWQLVAATLRCQGILL